MTAPYNSKLKQRAREEFQGFDARKIEREFGLEVAARVGLLKLLRVSDKRKGGAE